jgi:hypothetical protein
VRYREYRLYKGSSTIVDSYNEGKPLSIVGMADGRFGMVTKGKSIVMVVRGDFLEEV